MSDDKEFRPYVPADSDMPEFTVRALLLGLVMCVVLGAANAYLGLRAGMTIAATYPAAVIGMAVLRAVQGLAARGELRPDRRLDRRVGRGRRDLHDPGVRDPRHVELQELNMAEYLTASALMILGGILGIMFVTILRRVMVEDRSLPFPESVAASEIHKAGQRGADAAMQLFAAMGVGARDQAARRRRRLPRHEHVPGRGRQGQGELRAPRPRRPTRRRSRPAASPPSRPPTSPRPTSASATSSAPSSAR